MDVRFADDDLDRLETDPAFSMGLADALVRAYRRRMQAIRAAVDERDFREYKSWHFERLKGNRKHQHSIRLNRQFRLILEFERTSSGKAVVIVAIVDYHD